MESRVTSRCLRRSKSLKEDDVAKAKRKTSSPTQKLRLAKQEGNVSKSADDILVDLSHVTDVKQHGVLLVFNGFYKSETLRTLVGATFEQEILSYRQRSRSFHNRPNTANDCSTNRRAYSVRRIKSFCEPQTAKALEETTCYVQPSGEIEKRPTALRASKSYTGDTVKEKRGVQLKKCMSLYDRERKPHSCYHHTSKIPPTSKPSPWTYGGKNSQDNRKRDRKTSVSPSTVRKSTSGYFSIDSVDSRPSRLTSSLGSMDSSDLDISPKNNILPASKTHVAAAKSPKSHDKKTLESLQGDKWPKPCLIPRPVRPQSAPPVRSRSFTYGPSTGCRPVRVLAKSPRVTAKPLVRSTSVSEKMTSAVSNFDRGSCLNLVNNGPTVTGGKYFEDSLSSDSFDSKEGWNTKRLFVPESEADYPEPRPCQRPKAELFNPRDFFHIDQHALKATEDLLESFDELLDYLLQDLNSTLSRVRAIYRWVISQHLPLDLNAGEIIPNTPLGFLYNIRERKASYTELLATMCRRANIPCVIVYGVAKSVAYNVGDKVIHRKMKNSWNAVYIDGDWRFVHPYWARQSARGYNTGCWAVVESDDFHSECTESKQTVLHTVNDFFFLTDADKFITKCFPDDPSWQLLERHLSKKEFEELPFLQPAFYDLNLRLKSHHSCVIISENGKVELCIAMPPEKVPRYRFKYKLFIHRDWEAEGEYDQILLDRYLLHYVMNDSAFFEIRFPVSGVYKLEIHCYDSKRTMGSNWICDYKIICPEPMPNCEPLPIVPSIGWGPTCAIENAGLECLTHKTGVVNIDAEPVTFLRFALSKEKELSIEAQLLANKIPRGELQSLVTVEQDGEHAVVKVEPSKEGEYALQIFVQDKESDRRQNVCNYLMHRTKIVEDPQLADIRSKLAEATEAGEVDALTMWIDRFIERNMEDRGDLSEARKKLHLARLNRDIKEAIARKDLNLLEKTINSCSDTSIRRSLGELAGEAEAMRSRLRRLKRLQHAVLEMDQKTISEMRSYPKPPPAVHGVMAATFMLLGNKEAQLKKWRTIQGLISKRGKESLKRRVADFKIDDVPRGVLQRARAILAKYDLETVQIASIGAATFYQWAYTMAGESDH